jgi:hypothetical protein
MARFVLPAETFLETKIRENFPDFDIREGTGFRDMLIKPMTLLLQPFRDQNNIIKRNLSLLNFPLMLEDEFDQLVANIFVDRRTGTFATGTVRILFDTPTDVVLGSDIRFLTEDGRAFSLVDPVIVTAETMKFNQEGLLFFVDGAVIADDPGGETIPIGGIIFIEGAPANAVSVTNKAAISAGAPAETNTELFARAKQSIATRNLVTDKSISATLLETFNQLREVLVIGFGDSEMERDIVSVALSLGEVLGTKTTGEVTTPSKFEDFSGVDFVASLVAPGHELIILSGPNAGTHVITAVVSSTELTVSAPFTSSGTGISYQISGFIIKDDLHIGGKVDIYHDTTSLQDKEIVIDPIPVSLNVFVNREARDGAIIAGDDKLKTTEFDFIAEEVTTSDKVEILTGVNIGIFDIDGVLTNELDVAVTGGFTASDNQVRFRIIRSYYSGGALFTTPIILPTRVVRLDPITLEEIGSPLVEDSEFFLRVDDSFTRFSSLEAIHFEFDPLFVGTTMKIEYRTDPTIASVQTFVDARENRVVTADLLAKRAIPAFVDIDIEYRGSLDAVSTVEILKDFIDTIPFLETLQKSDLIASLYAFNANFVVSDFTMTVQVLNRDGTKTVTVDDDEIQIPRLAHFISRDITATNLGA